MEFLLFELLQKIIGVDTILFVGIIWTLALDIYIYMILIVILDALQQNMFMVYECPDLYGNILTYSSIHIQGLPRNARGIMLG